MRTVGQVLAISLFVAVAASVGAQPESALPVGPAERASRWDDAARAYRMGEYERALRDWQAVAESGRRAHPDVFYNMGNAYYQLGQPGHAAWMYEKALRLEPRHTDAWHNLALVRGGEVRGDVSTGSFLFLPFSWVSGLLTVGEWALVAAIAWWVAVLALSIAIVSSPSRVRRLSRRLAIVSGVLLVVSLAFFLPRLHQEEGVRYGIVLEDGAVVRAGPSEREPAYFEASVGDRMEVQPTPVRDWVRVKRSADGRVGYLPESAVGRI